MAINRLFLGLFNTKICGEEITNKKIDKTFDEILQEEQSKLMQMVSKMEKKWTTEHLYQKYDLKPKYHSPFNEE